MSLLLWTLLFLNISYHVDGNFEISSNTCLSSEVYVKYLTNTVKSRHNSRQRILKRAVFVRMQSVHGFFFIRLLVNIHHGAYY